MKRPVIVCYSLPETTFVYIHRVYGRHMFSTGSSKSFIKTIKSLKTMFDGLTGVLYDVTNPIKRFG